MRVEISNVHYNQFYKMCAAGDIGVWNRMKDVNAVIFHQLEDNHPCQEMDAGVAIVSSTKPDPSSRGH